MRSKIKKRMLVLGAVLLAAVISLFPGSRAEAAGNPKTYQELQQAIADASEGDTINLSELVLDAEYDVTVDKSLKFVGDGITLTGLEIIIANDKTLTLENITIWGKPMGPSPATIRGAAEGDKSNTGQLIVGNGASVIGGDQAVSSFNPPEYDYYRGTIGVAYLWSVVVDGGSITGGGDHAGSAKAENVGDSAVYDCRSLTVKNGGTITGGSSSAGAKGSAGNPAIWGVNHVEVIGSTVKSGDEKRGKEMTPGFIKDSHNITLKNANLIWGDGANGGVMLGVDATGGLYDRYEACGIDIEGTDLIVRDSVVTTGISHMNDGWCSMDAAAINFGVPDDADPNIPGDDKPTIHIGKNVTIKGGSTTQGNGSVAISGFGVHVAPILKVEDGVKIIGGNTAGVDQYGDANGGFGTAGCQVMIEKDSNVLIQGGKGVNGGFGITRCWSDSVLAGGQIIGGEGTARGGHAIFNGAKVTIDGATVTGGKGPQFVDEDHRAGGAVNSIRNLVMKSGELKPGEGKYATAYAGNLYLSGGTIYNCSGAVEPSDADIFKPAVELYAGTPMLQVSGGTIGYMKDNGAKYLGIWTPSTSYWTWFKESADGQWKDTNGSGNGWRLFSDEVWLDGVNITDKSILTSNYTTDNLTEPMEVRKNLLCYTGDDVTVRFGRAITDKDEVLIRARNWDKDGAPYEVLESDSYTVTDAAQGTITFKQPKRDIRVELREKPAIAISIKDGGDTIMKAGGRAVFEAQVTGTGASQELVWSVYDHKSAATAITQAGELTVGQDEPDGIIHVKVALKAEPDLYSVQDIQIANAKVNKITVTSEQDKLSFSKGESWNFRAKVDAQYGATEDITWYVEGAKSAGTTIGQEGRLTIGTDESAANLTVKAVSNFDRTKSGALKITVEGNGGRESGATTDGTSGGNGGQNGSGKGSAKTGDTNSPWVSLAGMLLAAGGILLIGRKKRSGR